MRVPYQCQRQTSDSFGVSSPLEVITGDTDKLASSRDKRAFEGTSEGTLVVNRSPALKTGRTGSFAAFVDGSRDYAALDSEHQIEVESNWPSSPLTFASLL